MNVTRESSNSTEVTLNILMDTDDEEPFINRSYRRLVSRLQIPGFRPGKAPRAIVERHLGRAALIQEALDFMIPETLDQVLRDQDIQAFVEPELELLEVEPVSFKAVVPLEPDVNLGEFRMIRLDRDPVEVTSAGVDEVIERLRFESGPWEPVERPVKFGDLLSLNVAGTILGEEAISNQGIDFIPQQDNLLPMPGFSVYLEGTVEGQEKEFSLTVPDDHPQSEYAGQECRFRVNVLSIKEKQLPELDDEFAKGIRDGYESLEALRSDVEERLTKDAETASLRQLEQNSLEELLKIAQVQASGLIYQRELDQMHQEQERRLRDQRLDMDTYLRFIGNTQEEWLDQLRPQAEQRLNTFLVMRKLAEEEGIDVDSDEIEAEIETLASSSGDSGESMRMALSTDSAKDSIRSSLLSRKVMERLVEIVQGQATSEAEAEEPPENSTQAQEESQEESQQETPDQQASDDETGEEKPDN
ncbi:MAG: trigger factor [SAR202 cluster bacterium Io17-Chloro-G9]|nr:MAG: trigger factor [SAR202 cluster bacterium Io17-Chloro-G9]